MQEYGHVDVPELQALQAALERDYRFTICTMNFPGYCEDVIARMIEFGKPLGGSNFNYMCVADTDHSMHYFYFNREKDARAFRANSRTTWGLTSDNVVADHSYMTEPTS